jgi:hypothetical protein
MFLSNPKTAILFGHKRRIYMACIGRFLEGWRPTLQNAFTLDQIEGRFFPARNAWGVPNIYDGQGGDLDIQNIEPAQCTVVAQHLSDDIFYDKLKIVGLVIAGVALTAAALAVALAVTVLVINFLAEVVLLGLLNIGMALTGEAGLSGFIAGAAFMATWLYAWFNIAFSTVTVVASIWNKEIMPHVHNGAQFVTHRTTQIRQLEFLARA